MKNPHLFDTKIPGICAQAIVVSSACRKNRGDVGAVDEALKQARSTMIDLLARWPEDKEATFFITVTVDSAGRKDRFGSQ